MINRVGDFCTVPDAHQHAADISPSRGSAHTPALFSRPICLTPAARARPGPLLAQPAEPNFSPAYPDGTRPLNLARFTTARAS